MKKKDLFIYQFRFAFYLQKQIYKIIMVIKHYKIFLIIQNMLKRVYKNMNLYVEKVMLLLVVWNYQKNL
jgi:hypothetical protein